MFKVIAEIIYVENVRRKDHENSGKACTKSSQDRNSIK